MVVGGETSRKGIEAMSEKFTGEWIHAHYEDPRLGHLGHRRQKEKVTRCRDCAFCRSFPQGLVCTMRGAVGWFETSAEGFCSLGKERA